MFLKILPTPPRKSFFKIQLPPKVVYMQRSAARQNLVALQAKILQKYRFSLIFRQNSIIFALNVFDPLGNLFYKFEPPASKTRKKLTP